MDIDEALSDEAVLRELGQRLAGVRLGLNWTQAYLANRAGVSKRTVERLETGVVAAQLSAFVRVCRALDLLDRLNALIPGPAPSPLAQLKLRGRKRRRASGRDLNIAAPKPWTWGEQS
jgi:transcriptional regulator with XRE-family HTH domain